MDLKTSGVSTVLKEGVDVEITTSTMILRPISDNTEGMKWVLPTGEQTVIHSVTLMLLQTVEI